MAPTRLARAMLAALGAAALAASTASATPIAGATGSAAGVVIRFTYVGGSTAPAIDLHAGLVAARRSTRGRRRNLRSP